MNKKLVGLFITLVISLSTVVFVTGTDIDKPYNHSIAVPVEVTIVNN